MKSRGKRGSQRVKENKKFKRVVLNVVLIILFVAALSFVFLGYKGWLGNVVLTSSFPNSNSGRVSLVSPSDGSVIPNSNFNQTFSCSANSSMNAVANITLFVYNSSGYNVARGVQSYSLASRLKLLDYFHHLFFDSEGNIYTLNWRVMNKYSSEVNKLWNISVSSYTDGGGYKMGLDKSGNSIIASQCVTNTPFMSFYYLKLTQIDSNGKYKKGICTTLSSEWYNSVLDNPALDSAGNIYLIIEADIYSTKQYQWWVAAFDHDLQRKWAVLPSTSSSLGPGIPTSIAAGSSGNVYVAYSRNPYYIFSSAMGGWNPATEVLSNLTLIGFNAENGQQKFVSSWMPLLLDGQLSVKYPCKYSTKIITDSSGNIYVKGLYSGDVLHNVTYDIGFVSKFDSSGKHLWDKVFNETHAGPGGISTDSFGNLLLGFGFIKYNSQTIFSSYNLSASSYNIYKINPSGNVISNISFVYTLAPFIFADINGVDSSNVLYITGRDSLFKLSQDFLSSDSIKQASWNFTLPYQDNYKWNCQTCDLFNNCTMALSNYSIKSAPPCVVSLVNTSWSSWANVGCAGVQMNQSRSLIQYDLNNCEVVLNTTLYQYQLTGPNLTNTSWSSWANYTLCNGNVDYTQRRNFTQYDFYGCALNQTFFDYQNINCFLPCTENDWIFNITPLVCPSSRSQTKNWTKVGTCMDGIYYPSSEIISCIYYPLTIIGNVSNISTNVVGLSLYINGSSNIINPHIRNTMKVELKNNGKSLLELNHNFSARELDLSKIKVKSNNTGNVSSVIISGLNDTKTIYIDLIGDRSRFNSICIKDAEINSLSEISSSCNGSSEFYVNSIPYNSNGYTANYIDTSNSSVVVTGLMHSGVVQQCTENWQCFSWTDCSNDMQNRNCTDTNNCGSVNTKPNIIQACSSDTSLSSGSTTHTYNNAGSLNSSTSKNNTGVTNLSGQNIGSVGSSFSDSSTSLSSPINSSGDKSILSSDRTFIYYMLVGALVIAILIILMIILFIYRKRK